MRAIVLMLVLLFSLSHPVIAQETQWVEPQLPEKEQERAYQAARSWLQIVDEARYQDSWLNSAVFLRESISMNQFEASLKAVRFPLGKAVSREVLSIQNLTSLPNAPQGNYMVIQFKTKFENKAEAVETITPMIQYDGNWRVSGYYIK